MIKFKFLPKVMLAGLLFLLPYLLSAQSMRIGRGASVVIQGDASLVLNDAGLVNDGSFSGKGTVVFTGEQSNARATIAGRGKTAFGNLLISRPFNQVVLEKNISVNGVLTMSAGNLELNNYTLHLGSTGMIRGEHINSRITGTKGGSVIAIAELNAPANINPGNIGVQLSSSANLGRTVITRGHVQQVNARGESGIHRYYNIQPAYEANNVTLRFFYLEPELGSNNESELVLWSGENATGWRAAGKETSDAANNWLVKNNLSKLNRFTLGVANNSSLANSLTRSTKLPGLSAVEAYPNPARDRFTVAFYSDGNKEGSVSLQDAAGKVLQRRQVQYFKGMNTMQWNISKYAAGTYFLVFENTGMVNLKVVKQ